jgi:hypothetical protein
MAWQGSMIVNLARRHHIPVMVFWRDKEHDGAVVDWLRAQAGLLPIELVRPNHLSRSWELVDETTQFDHPFAANTVHVETGSRPRLAASTQPAAIRALRHPASPAGDASDPSC